MMKCKIINNRRLSRNYRINEFNRPYKWNISKKEWYEKIRNENFLQNTRRFVSLKIISVVSSEWTKKKFFAVKISDLSYGFTNSMHLDCVVYVLMTPA